VEERLFLDWIALYPTNISPRNVESASAVVADLANSRLAFVDRAAVSAGVTANTLSIELFVEITFTDARIDDVAKGGHCQSPDPILSPIAIGPTALSAQTFFALPR